MWQWISSNSGALSALASLGMMIIWLTYLQLLYQTFLRNRRTTILINRGVGTDLQARCLISNMSPEPIYIESIIATLSGQMKELTASVTDFDNVEDARGYTGKKTMQGPVPNARYMDLGTFSDLMDQAARHHGIDSDQIEVQFTRLDLTVVAAYGPEDLPVAASRSFELRGETAGQELIPLSVSARQIRSKRQRKKLDNYIAQDL